MAGSFRAELVFLHVSCGCIRRGAAAAWQQLYMGSSWARATGLEHGGAGKHSDGVITYRALRAVGANDSAAASAVVATRKQVPGSKDSPAARDGALRRLMVGLPVLLGHRARAARWRFRRQAFVPTTSHPCLSGTRGRPLSCRPLLPLGRRPVEAVCARRSAHHAPRPSVRSGLPIPSESCDCQGLVVPEKTFSTP